MRISVVIPVYNSARSLERLLGEIEQYFGRRASDRLHEIRLVDDCSDEETSAVLDRIESQGRAVVLRPGVKLGQQKALYLGLLGASGDVAVTMDDDLQHDVSDLGAMLGQIGQGADLVFGIYRDHGGGIAGRLGSALVGSFFRRNFPALEDLGVSSYRCIARRVYEALPRPMPEGFLYLSAELIPLSSRVANVPVDRRKRPFGKSGYTIRGGIRILWKLRRKYGKSRPKERE